MSINVNEIEQKVRLKIKFERIKKAVSQEELATLAGLSTNAIWKIESGKVSPTLDSLIRIADSLDMTISELLDLSKIEL